MNATKSASLLLMLVLGLAGAGWYFASPKPMFRLDANTLSTSTDTIVHNLKVRQFGTDGHLINLLHTPLLHHIPLNNTHKLQSPHIVIKEPNQAPVEIHANEALALYGGQQITLNQEVVIHQKKTDKSVESTLKTESMTYFPKTKFATTEKKTTVERPGSVISSMGMNAYLAEKRITLLNKARGTYEPRKG
jgi:lipopolysaccharide export system protein LptC